MKRNKTNNTKKTTTTTKANTWSQSPFVQQNVKASCALNERFISGNEALDGADQHYHQILKLVNDPGLWSSIINNHLFSSSRMTFKVITTYMEPETSKQLNYAVYFSDKVTEITSMEC